MKKLTHKQQAQKIFEKVARHLFKQGRQAAKRNGDCVYRTKSGLKCAVGVLIKDNEYTPEMEGNGIDNLMKYFGLNRFKPHCEMLRSLQMFHDCNPFIDNPYFREDLKEIGREYRLKIGFLNNLSMGKNNEQ